jgi:hypothetical protein
MRAPQPSDWRPGIGVLRMNELYFAGTATAASERRDRCRRIVGTNAPALAVTARLLSFANPDPNSPFRGVVIDDIEMLDGRLRHKSDPARSLSIADIMRRHDLTEITETHQARPSPERQKYASLAHGAQFVARSLRSRAVLDHDLEIINYMHFE